MSPNLLNTKKDTKFITNKKFDTSKKFIFKKSIESSLSNMLFEIISRSTVLYPNLETIDKNLAINALNRLLTAPLPPNFGGEEEPSDTGTGDAGGTSGGGGGGGATFPGGDEGGEDDDAGMEPDEDEPADTEPESDMI